ncbi:MAG: hypothetical protein WCT27_02665 [Patescibacteria group bacterium]|jgi:hypothetical protein
MLKKLLHLLFVVIAMLLVFGCSTQNDQITAPKNQIDETLPECIDFPQELPAGISIGEIEKSLESRTDIPFGMLIPQVLEELGSSYSPEEYYIDSSGLHWGHAKRVAELTAAGDCYHPYGLSIVGTFHFVYWFSYRPSSYNAYMSWIPIYAQPYGPNGILVQKRDICWICGCNPVCALLWTWICAK